MESGWLANVLMRCYIRPMKRKDPIHRPAPATAPEAVTGDFGRLLEAVLAMRTPAELHAFLLDLCTPAELEAIADRWRVVPLLLHDVPYREIHDRTGVSVTTIGRVARCLEYGAGGYRLAPQLVLDSLSLPFAFFTTALCGVVGGFAHRYLHREPGFNRFFVMLGVFATGMQLVILANDLAVAFIGWELIGLSSAMLVAFFHDRELPVKNGVRVFAIYRVGDMALLGAAVLAHHGSTLAVALLLLLAAMVKSAQVPFSDRTA